MLLSHRKNVFFTGIDLSEYAVEICRQRMSNDKTVFFQGELPHLSFDDDSFDMVICMAVLPYLDADTQEMSINEIIRLLKDNGRALISIWIENSGDKERFEHLMKKHFSDVTIRYNYNMLYQKYFEPRLLYIYDALYKRNKLGLWGKPFGLFARVILKSSFIMYIFYFVNRLFWPDGISHVFAGVHA